MRIEKIRRWQWMLLGLAVGLLLGWTFGANQPKDWPALSDAIGTQERFESILLQQENGKPLFDEVMVRPVLGSRGKFLVTGRYHNGSGESAGRLLCFEAPTPYKAGPAMARVSTASKIDLNKRYAAIAGPTVRDYLSLMDEAGYVDYQYAWWEVPKVGMLLWALGGIIALGLVWPTIVNLLTYGRVTAPREADGVDLSAVASSISSTKPQPADEVDLGQLHALEAELERSLKAGEAAAPIHGTPAPPPELPARALSGEPLAPVTADGNQDQHFALKPRDFYPVEHRGKRGFSLIELLVVIGVIVLLMGILLPVLTGVRKHGKQVKCASNLRQIGQGLEIYNQVNHALPDLATPDGLSSALIEIRAATQPLFHCPADESNALGYSMNGQFAGLPKSSGKPSDMLASETAARHPAGMNMLYFDGHVAPTAGH